jgi:hypothetical protein
MGYYDFDHHFWSPREVCGQLPVQHTPKGFWGTSPLIGFFLRVFSRQRDFIPPAS